MSALNLLLVKSNLKQLRLPTMHAEFEKLAREAAQANEGESSHQNSCDKKTARTEPVHEPSR